MRRGDSLAVDNAASGVYLGGKRKARAVTSTETAIAPEPNKRIRPTAVVSAVMADPVQADATDERATPKESLVLAPEGVVRAEVVISLR